MTSFLLDIVLPLIQRSFYDAVSLANRMQKSRNQSADSGLIPLVISLSDSPGKCVLPIPAALGPLPSKKKHIHQDMTRPLLNYQLRAASYMHHVLLANDQNMNGVSMLIGVTDHFHQQK